MPDIADFFKRCCAHVVQMLWWLHSKGGFPCPPGPIIIINSCGGFLIANVALRWLATIIVRTFLLFVQNVDVLVYVIRRGNFWYGRCFFHRRLNASTCVSICSRRSSPIRFFGDGFSRAFPVQRIPPSVPSSLVNDFFPFTNYSRTFFKNVVVHSNVYRNFGVCLSSCENSAAIWWSISCWVNDITCMPNGLSVSTSSTTRNRLSISSKETISWFPPCLLLAVFF